MTARRNGGQLQAVLDFLQLFGYKSSPYETYGRHNMQVKQGGDRGDTAATGLRSRL
jgi:hypothetical protein